MRGLPSKPLELASTGEGPAQGDLVRVLQVPADGEAARQSRHPDGQVVDLLRDKERRRLAGRVRVGRDDELGGPFFADAFEELGYTEVFWFYSVQRGEGAAKDVVEAAVLVGAFHRADIVGVFDHADHRLVAAGGAGDIAHLSLGQVEATP